MGIGPAWIADVDASDIISVCGILIFLVLIGMVGVLWARKYLRGGDGDISDLPAAGFTLKELKRLYEAGQLSAEEFEKARTKVTIATKKAADEAAAAAKKAAENAIRARDR